MALTTRNIYTPSGHGLFAPNGSPRKNIEIRFTLVKTGTTLPAAPFDAITLDRVGPTFSVFTNALGEFTTPLWPNDRGDIGTQYICHIEGGYNSEDFRAALPSGAAAVTWADFMALGVPLTPTELSAFATHIADTTVHVVPAGHAGLMVSVNATGDGISYTSPSDVFVATFLTGVISGGEVTINVGTRQP